MPMSEADRQKKLRKKRRKEGLVVRLDIYLDRKTHGQLKGKAKRAKQTLARYVRDTLHWQANL